MNNQENRTVPETSKKDNKILWREHYRDCAKEIKDITNKMRFINERFQTNPEWQKIQLLIKRAKKLKAKLESKQWFMYKILDQMDIRTDVRNYFILLIGCIIYEKQDKFAVVSGKNALYERQTINKFTIFIQADGNRFYNKTTVIKKEGKPLVISIPTKDPIHGMNYPIDSVEMTEFCKKHGIKNYYCDETKNTFCELFEYVFGLKGKQRTIMSISLITWVYILKVFEIEFVEYCDWNNNGEFMNILGIESGELFNNSEFESGQLINTSGFESGELINTSGFESGELINNSEFESGEYDFLKEFFE